MKRYFPVSSSRSYLVRCLSRRRSGADLGKSQKSRYPLSLPGGYLCGIFYLGRVDHHSLSALYVADPAEKMEVF